MVLTQEHLETVLAKHETERRYHKPGNSENPVGGNNHRHVRKYGVGAQSQRMPKRLRHEPGAFGF